MITEELAHRSEVFAANLYRVVVPQFDAVFLDVGARVYYLENGPEDTGTIRRLSVDSEFPYFVRWDDGEESDWYTPSQLVALEV